jgi:hypothetical protein
MADASTSDELAVACQAAARKAADLGHQLGAWVAPPGEEASARRSSCSRCKRAVYVRAEGDLVGMAGRAVVEACER